MLLGDYMSLVGSHIVCSHNGYVYLMLVFKMLISHIKKNAQYSSYVVACRNVDII